MNSTVISEAVISEAGYKIYTVISEVGFKMYTVQISLRLGMAGLTET